MKQTMKYTVMHSLGFSYPNGHGNYNNNTIYCINENVILVVIDVI